MEKKIKKVLKKELQGITLILAIVFILLGAILGYVVYDAFNKEGFTKIALNGEEVVNISLGTEYTDEGCTLVIDDKDYSNDVMIKGSVDIEVEGTYILTYEYENNGSKIILTRVVNVVGGVSNE